MTPTRVAELGMLAVTALTGLGVLAAVATPARLRVATVAMITFLLGTAATATGVAALLGATVTARMPGLLPLTGVEVHLDALGGLFVAVTGVVVALAAIYGAGYAGHGHGPAGRGAQAMIVVFAASMILVPVAASVTTFLILWELMAGASLLLIISEHRRRAAVVDAGWWYAVMTQAGFVAILIGLTMFAAGAGGQSFAELRAAHLNPVLGGGVFILLLIGFGAKSGLVPAHVWLPRAHPEAPTHVSAMLSAAMVNLGAYGVVRFGFDILGGGARWWWLLAFIAGAASALYGILQAAVASDLKRLLAYSTVDNMGLIFIGIGAAGVLRASGSTTLAGLALAAAMLHVVNHAGFKTLLFFGAGSVLRATGTRDLDALGGLRSRLPVTTVMFAFGALAAAALPPGNGFVSEWLLLQSLVPATPTGGVVTAVVMPLAVAAVALTAGLAVATYVKAFGVGFLARPRSESVEHARESPPSMLIAMGLAAAACFALALAPAWLGGPLTSVVNLATGQPAGADIMAGGVTLKLAGIASTVSPLGVTGALIVALALTAAGTQLVRAGVRRRRAAALWDCGAGAPTARMQYTATSFAEPLQRVFDDVLAPQIDVNVTPREESRYLVAKVAYLRRVPDRIEHRLYHPLLGAGRRLGRLGGVIGNGSVHRYLGYGFVGVISLLVVLAVTR